MWTTEATVQGQGVYNVYVHRPNRKHRNITYFRDAPMKIDTLSYGDPFGDATAQFTLPGVTPYDDPQAVWFLKEWTNYDVFWIPATTSPGTSPLNFQVYDYQTQRKSLWLNFEDRVKIWEGYSVSYELTDQGASIQCQGALYQVDRYLAKPSYPSRPIAMERLIAQMFNPKKRPLRSKKLRIDWPEGWELVFEGGEPTPYKPRGVKRGNKWTGYATRNTGSWDRALTGYTQDLIAQMYTDEDSGVEAGNQWSIRNYPGRQPVLEIRDVNRPVDFEVWYGTPGVTCALQRDAMSAVNVVYGQGTGFDGVPWSNMEVSFQSELTTFNPIAYDEWLYPYRRGRRHRQFFPAETLVKFSEGVALDEGTKSAKTMLQREKDPGFTGNMTLRAAPHPDMPLWKIRAGMTVLLRGYAGNHEGIRFHVAEVTHSVTEGQVDLRIDTSYRDLLTLEEVQARVRDPLTPAKLLSVNRRSIMIEDSMAPWDESAGSGYLPRESRELFHNMPEKYSYPWEKWIKDHPPKSHGKYYIEVDADNNNTKRRWTETQVLMAQAGSIRMIQIVCVDKHGDLLKIPFHVSIYKYTKPSLPHSQGSWSPFIQNHFQNMDASGAQFPAGTHFTPDIHMIVGWGNADQKCGYTPNRSSEGADPTGLFMDESIWSWDMSEITNKFDPRIGADPRKNRRPAARSLYMMIYAEGNETAYFIGKMWRLIPGT